MYAILMILLLLVTGCTTVHDLGGGRAIVPRVAEVRSPFGTNMGFVKLEACDAIPRDASWTDPTGPATVYVNCQDVTGWTMASSQGQGGQIVSGVLQMGGLLGLGALMPASSGSTVSANSTANSSATATSVFSPGHGHGGHK